MDQYNEPVGNITQMQEVTKELSSADKIMAEADPVADTAILEESTQLMAEVDKALGRAATMEQAI